MTIQADSPGGALPDAFVVGGGIAGCLTALLLGRAGMKVTVLEADSVGSHASGFAFGGLGPLDGSGIPDPPAGLQCLVFQPAPYHPRRAEGGYGDRHAVPPAGTGSTWPSPRTRPIIFGPDLEWQSRVPGFRVEWLDATEAVKAEPRTNPECAGAACAQGTGAVESIPLQPGGGPGGGETWGRDGAGG